MAEVESGSSNLYGGEVRNFGSSNLKFGPLAFDA
jgi:hypothetical protein